jgi:hypothetical protein
MENLKAATELLEPDPRNLGFVKITAQEEIIRMTIGDFHKSAELIVLMNCVPEDVRSYFETIKNLFVFGWYHYPFCTLAAFLATTAVEMALRLRYPRPEPDYRSFRKLLERAKTDGLLSDEKFQTLLQNQSEMARMMGEEENQVTRPPFAEIVSYSLPRLRNNFAHPGGHWIWAPGPALDMLFVSAEVINALWT